MSIYASSEIVPERTPTVNILVMGAGAIGSVFGGFLAHAGHRVSLIAREAHARAIASQGLLIDGIWGTRRVRSLAAYTALAAIPDPRAFDAVLLAVKSYDTPGALGELLQILPDMPPVVSLQNGLGNVEIIADMAGRHKTIGGRLIFGVECIEPGHVTVTVSADNTKIGGFPGGCDPAFIDVLAQVLTAAGIPTDAVPDIDRYIWGKVLYNCALNALATVLNTHYGRLLAHEGTKEIMARIVEEIYMIALARGVKLDWPEPQDYCTVLFNELIPRTFDHHPSMLQDIQKGKKTEIDALNGAVLAKGVELGMEAPYNWAITQLIKAKEYL